MTRKERTKIRRNNYRTWKQAQKQKQQSATPASPAAPAPSAEPPSAAAAPHLAPAKNGTSATPTAPFPGALIPFNPGAPVDVVMLHQRLRYGGPEVTDEERIAIAHRLLRDDLRRFCIPWPPAGESESAPPASAPGQSTGPRTPAGLARSSQNARTRGLSSLTSVFVPLPGEDPKEWIELLRDLTNEFQPASRTERILVTDMAQSHSLTQRAINLQTSSIEDPKAFALYLRYQTTHHRAYFRALKQLMTLQKSRAQSGAPHIVDQPAPDFDGTIDIDTIPRPSYPVAPQPDTLTESMTLPKAA